MKKRLTLEEVKNKLKTINSNIEIISDKYINNSTPLKCKCLICNHEWSPIWANLNKGKGCPECAPNKKLTLDKIKEKLKSINPNIIILSNTYKNNRTNLQCRCLVCNHKWGAPWQTLNKGHGCPECGHKLKADKLRLDFDDIKEKLKEINPDIKILDDNNNYINNKQDLKCECLICNHKWDTSWSVLQRGHGCAKCANVFKLTLEEIKNRLKFINYNIIILSDEYVNARAMLKCKCLIDGNEWETSWDSLQRGVGCKVCAIKNNSGENHYLWNGGRKSIYYYLRTAIVKWREDTLKKYKYRCIITNKTNDLEVHHLFLNFSDIIQETMRKTNIPFYREAGQYTIEQLLLIKEICLNLHYKYGLGIPLNRKVHRKFHGIYGNKNNTPEQFEEFKRRCTERGGN